MRPRRVASAIERAISNEDAAFAETHWADVISSGGDLPQYGGVRLGGRLIDSRQVHVEVDREAAFTPTERIGGTRGWYFANWLWSLRGFLDLLVGGVGVRRGRRHPNELRVGDRLDWWRVEVFEAGSLLRLAAEMKVPGRAWLQFEVKTNPSGGCDVCQTALFDPRGLSGLLYWYGIYPIHALVFRGMLKAIASQATCSNRPR